MRVKVVFSFIRQVSLGLPTRACEDAANEVPESCRACILGLGSKAWEERRGLAAMFQIKCGIAKTYDSPADRT